MIYSIYEVKKKGDKETEVQVGVKGHIIPLEFVIDYKLKDLKDDVTSKENRLSEIGRLKHRGSKLSSEEQEKISAEIAEQQKIVQKAVATR